MVANEASAPVTKTLTRGRIEQAEWATQLSLSSRLTSMGRARRATLGGFWWFRLSRQTSAYPPDDEPDAEIQAFDRVGCGAGYLVTADALPLG